MDDRKRPQIRLWALFALLTMTACARAPAESPLNTGINGEALYVEHCAECHGAQGEGQPNWRTPNENGVYPAPPHDSSGHTWHHPDELLLQIIAEDGSMPNTGMPAFADTLNQAEMEDILAHIKTFWGSQEREFQQEVTRQRR